MARGPAGDLAGFGFGPGPIEGGGPEAHLDAVQMKAAAGVAGQGLVGAVTPTVGRPDRSVPTRSAAVSGVLVALAACFDQGYRFSQHKN